MLLLDILKNIKEGNFSSILQIPNLCGVIESGKHIEQIFVAFSHFIYFEESVSSQQLTSLLELIDIINKNRDIKNYDLKIEAILESYFYVLVHGIKKGFTPWQTLQLAEQMETILNANIAVCDKKKDVIKKIYSNLWNLSFQKSTESDIIIKLQTSSLTFLILSGESISTVCSICLKVAKLRDDKDQSALLEMDFMYTKVLNSICNFLTYKPSICCSSVITLNLVLLEYAFVLLKLNRYEVFSKLCKTLAVKLEPICEMQVTMSFKMSVKIVEAGIALVLKKITSEMFNNMVKMCKLIDVKNRVINSIMIDSLLQVNFIFEFYSASNLEISNELSRTILGTICNRYTAESCSSTDTTVKVLQTFADHLNTYACKISDSSSDTHQVLLDEALSYAKLIKTLVEIHFEVSECMDTSSYNIGVNSCNLGVYAYKLDNFLMAAEFFGIGVDFLHYCTKLFPKTNAVQIIRKKAMLLKDSLRLANCLKEAGLKTVHLVLQGILPHSEIIPTWVKCKRGDIKSGKRKLKNITIKDIYEETLCLKEIPPSQGFSIEELLLQEIEGLKQLGLDTVEEEMICSKALIQSSTIFMQVEGYINLAQVLWSHPEHPQVIVSKSAVDTINCALTILSCCDMERRHTLQLLARIHFWMYLCKLQEIQQRAEVEIHNVEKETQSLTAHSTDLGEEIQANDACNIRPSTTVTTFSMQEKTLEHLYMSLQLWEEVIQLSSIKSPVDSCNILLSILHILKFCGLLTYALKAIVILLSFSQKCDLEIFWIQGLVELLHFAPELVSMDVIERLISIIEHEEQKLDQSTNYLKYEALVSLAYYYYKIGQCSRGAEYLKKCMVDPLMEKRSIAACEVQVEVLFVASLYSLLPQNTLPHNLRITEPCLALALMAARKAIGLVMTAIEHETGIFCHNFKVAWAHHKTNIWYGRLCQITAQPRSARAYLRQGLSLAEKFASPLRTAESLSLLAEIDLQCDQLEDCRVKIDSLDSLFRIHKDSFPEEKTNVTTSYISHKPCNQDIPLKTKKWSDIVTIHKDGFEESMRETDISPDYKLYLPTVNFFTNIVIGEEDRISQLAHPNLLLSSPSILYREENYVVNKINCPLDVIECSICVSPEIHCISIRLASMMAMIHSQQGNSGGALKCLMQAERQLEDFDKLSHKITSLMLSILEKVDHSELVFSCNDRNKNGMFLQSKMILANLHYSLHCQEILCLEQDFGEAHSKNLNSLKFISELPSSVLSSHLSTVAQLILLGYSIESSIRAKTLKEKEGSACVPYCSPYLNVAGCKEDISDENFKTPIRPRPGSNAISGRPTSVSTTKTRRNIATEMLTATLHKPSKDDISFFILPDDEETVSDSKSRDIRSYAKKSFAKAKSNLKVPCREIKKAPLSKVMNNQKQQIVKNSIQPFIDNLETSFDSLSINESSPFSDILQLPKKEQLIMKYDQSAKTYAGSAIKKSSIKMSKVKQQSQNDINRSKVVAEKIVKCENDSAVLQKVSKKSTVAKDDCDNIPPNSRSNKVMSRKANESCDVANLSIQKSNASNVAEQNLPNTRSRSTRAKPCKN